MRPRVFLASPIGVSSGATLLGHFLDHYRRLGVDEFLLVLHAETSDPRAQDMIDIMARQGISPCLRATEFNTRLKLERYRALIGEHCQPEDWILYADIDEFHAYPTAIHDLLAGCDDAGFRFVRGRMRDRLAKGGQLVPMKPVPSLWDQFPFRASVTSKIRQGWDHKVCAAKPDVIFDEGGMHCLSYGDDRLTNYQMTYIDPRGFPDLIEIDHFAWDDALLKRINAKLAGLGGDSDSTDDPVVMGEYERVRDHLLAHGNIAADDIEVAPLATHRYERPPSPAQSQARPPASCAVNRRSD